MPEGAQPPEGSPRGLLEIVRSAHRGSLRELFWELVRFGWVGFFTLGMYAVEMWGLVHVVSWPTWVNATISYIPCLITNYVLHRSFTFRSDRDHMQAGPRYLVIQLGGLAINTSMLWLGVERLGWPFWPAQVAAIALLAAWSYLGQKLWTFEAGSRAASK